MRGDVALVELRAPSPVGRGGLGSGVGRGLGEGVSVQSRIAFAIKVRPLSSRTCRTGRCVKSTDSD